MRLEPAGADYTRRTPGRVPASGKGMGWAWARFEPRHVSGRAFGPRHQGESGLQGDAGGRDREVWRQAREQGSGQPGAAPA